MPRSKTKTSTSRAVARKRQSKKTAPDQGAALERQELFDHYWNVQNIYEVATMPWLTRSWIYEGIQDADRDIPPSIRQELMRQARNWEKNDPIVKRLVSVFTQYVSGPNGLAIIPGSEDNAFNAVATKWWASWSKFPLLNGKHPIGVVQSVLCRRFFIDGEIFLLKTQSKETNRPRLQLIESQRVTSPAFDRNPDTGNRIVDGVEISPEGRPVAYWVTEQASSAVGSLMGGPYQDTYTNSGLIRGAYPNYGADVHHVRIEAEQMIHLFEPERADQYRGISHLYPVMRMIHDLYDLRKFEMLSAKDQAEISKFVTNATGTAPTRGTRASQLAVQSVNAAGQAITKQTQIVTQPTMGGNTRYLRTGESVQFVAPTRPSPATQWFFDWILKSICMGVGISPMLVFPWSIQGTVLRADLDVMTQFFRSRSTVLGAVMREVYVYVIGWAIRFDRALAHYPPSWADCTVRPPRSVNVDVGRNSAALIAEYEAGWRTLQDICADLGSDWREVRRQRYVEADYEAELKQQFPRVQPSQVQQVVPQGAKNEARAEYRVVNAETYVE